jgi:hypothetical protein
LPPATTKATATATTEAQQESPPCPASQKSQSTASSSTTTNVNAYRRQQKDLLANTLALPTRWFNGRRSLPPVTDWPKHPQPALRNKHVILITPDGTCTSGPTGKLRYDHTTGIERI